MQSSLRSIRPGVSVLAIAAAVASISPSMGGTMMNCSMAQGQMQAMMQMMQGMMQMMQGQTQPGQMQGSAMQPRQN